MFVTGYTWPSASGVRGVHLLSQIVTQVYQHVHNWPNRVHKFDDLAKLLSTAYGFLQFKRLIMVCLTGHDMPHSCAMYKCRWLSLGNALKATMTNYQPLMMLLDEEAASGDPTSIGLHLQLSSYKVVALLHLTANVLHTTNNLCRIFQYRDLSFMTIKKGVCNMHVDKNVMC